MPAVRNSSIESNSSARPFVRATGQIAVDRAIAELRRGGLVAIRASRDLDRLAIAAGSEMATRELISQMSAIAGSEPRVVLTRNRAVAVLGSGTEAPAVSVAMAHDLDVDSVLDLADPTRHACIPSGLTALPERADTPATAAVKLVKLSRLLPSALVASVHGISASTITAWARELTLLVVDAVEIERFAETSAHRLIRAATAKVPMADAEHCEVIAFRPMDGGTEHVAIRIGNQDSNVKPIMIRIHSACLTGDLLGSLRCDCGEQLRGAIREIADSGGGVLLYLSQEGRDIGLINKLRAYTLQDLGADTVEANTTLGFDDDERVYFPAAEMLRQLGINRVRLMTNNPSKVNQLAACGVKVVERVPHIFASNSHNERYLATKAKRSGHLL
ncbi:GTP cyclohydrolase II [Candidatus Endolissoclinum faulkneri L2]|uniref:GTP cyclohydrolase-2 n=1 Tax=Candidatus Endolissoclinum faulkneri L2 TaxID=1193729 RepID=K7YGL4_9PROT|nr:GTP cyclohydrolase II [Candidatus Endolissoclinum faulkneri]AFX98735.1 GTP cyclohydrolase II [Candidatus Endolissoclinum faulkneri L2]